MPVLAFTYQTGLSRAWENVATFLPKLIVAVIILVIGYIIAKVAAKLVNAILERVGFDRAVERGGIRNALAKSKYDASDLVAKLVYYLILLITLQMAFGVFGSNPISDLLKSVIAYLPKVLVAMLIIVLAAFIAKVVSELLTAALGGLSYGPALAKAAGIAILVFGAFAALDELQIAQRIVTGLYYALLAIIVGSGIVAIGGGGIKTMQRYWERGASTMEVKGTEVKQQVKQQAAARPEPTVSTERGQTVELSEPAGSRSSEQL